MFQHNIHDRMWCCVYALQPGTSGFSFLPPYTLLQPCCVASKAKNNVKSWRLMFLVSFYFQTSHLVGYIVWHWVLGCSFGFHTALCVCLNQIFNLDNWNGWSNSGVAFPQVFGVGGLVCVCVWEEEGDRVVFGVVWNDVDHALHRGGWGADKGAPLQLKSGYPSRRWTPLAAPCCKNSSPEPLL